MRQQAQGSSATSSILMPHHGEVFSPPGLLLHAVGLPVVPLSQQLAGLSTAAGGAMAVGPTTMAIGLPVTSLPEQQELPAVNVAPSWNAGIQPG